MNRHPIGTGAFRFVRFDPQREIVLEANPAYWDPDLPRLDRLVFRFLPPEVQIENLLSGKLHVVTEIPGTETLRIQSSRRARIVKNPALSTVAASFNTSAGPLTDIRVREALNYATDKAALVRYDLLGNGRPVNSLVLPEYVPPEDGNGLNPYAYDPLKAKNLLKEAGVPARLKLRMIEVKATRAAKIIAKSWDRAGIDVELVSTTEAKIGEDLQKGPWDVVLGACPDPMYHPFFIHSIFLYSLSPFSLTRDEKLDRLIEQLVQVAAPEEGTRNVKTLERYVNENALTLFTYQKIKTYGVQNGVRFEPSLSGMPYFRTAELSAEAQP